MVYLPAAVTHRSTNWAQRRVTSFQPKRVTNYVTPPASMCDDVYSGYVVSAMCASDKRHGGVHGPDASAQRASASAAASVATVAAAGRRSAQQSTLVCQRCVSFGHRFTDPQRGRAPHSVGTGNGQFQRTSMKPRRLPPLCRIDHLSTSSAAFCPSLLVLACVHRYR